MTIDLDKFAQQQLDNQGLSVKEFSKRSGLGLSHAYQILRGERKRPSAETLEAVARGLSMTTAEMLIAMRRSASGDADPDEAEWLALVRQLPDEKKDAAKDMLRWIAATPVPPTKRRTERPAKSPETDLHEIDNTPTTKGKRGPLPTGNRKLQPVHRVRGPMASGIYRTLTVLALPWVNRDFRPAQAAV